MEPADRDHTSGADDPAAASRQPRRRPTLELPEDERFLELPTRAEVEALVDLGARLPALSFTDVPERPPPTRPDRGPTILDGPSAGAWDWLFDTMVVLVALACIAVAARPAVRGRDAAAAQVSLRETITEWVAPTAPPPPELEPGERRDPLARLGRDLRVAMGRYEAIAGMFARGRLSCAQLREAYVEVGDGWTSYSIALVQHRQDLSQGLAYRDEELYRDVQTVDADFTASGCNRP